MRKTITILFCFLFAFDASLFSQEQKRIDSILALLPTMPMNEKRIDALSELGSLYQSSNTLRSFEYAVEALSLAEKLNIPKKIGEENNNLGDLYWYNSDYAASSDHYFKALKIFERLKDQKEIGNCYRNIGWIYVNQKNYVKALEFYDRSKSINKQLKLDDKVAQNNNDIGSLYAEMKKYDLAIGSYAESLRYHQNDNDLNGLTVNYENMGIIFKSMGETEKAKEYLERSLKYALQIGDNAYYKSTAYCNVGGIYIDLKRYDDAIKNLKMGLEIAEKVDYKNTMAACYESLAKAYAEKKEPAEAYTYAILLSSVKDSIFNQENNRQVNQMTVQYETKKKELKINSLEKDNALADEKLDQEKKFKIYLISFCLLIAGFSFFLLRSNVQRKKTNQALSSAYKEIEIKNKDITDSINYSKRIQDAILPPKELKIKMFPDAFVLFKPKDIVSGDFYWFAEKNGRRLIAACDCTGHGVPGALMSMIGNNILNQTVSEKNITQPSVILDQLNHEVIKSLKQNELSQTRDGMDIAMLTFADENNFEFAGAQRPLWIIRRSGTTPVLEEIKPDKFSIGGLQSEQKNNFTNHKIKLEKGDCVYIFSDGYVDQFGGPEGKKFLSRNFKDLLVSICALPMLEQEKILEDKMIKWIGNNIQVDDILVIGIKA